MKEYTFFDSQPRNLRVFDWDNPLDNPDVILYEPPSDLEITCKTPDLRIPYLDEMDCLHKSYYRPETRDKQECSRRKSRLLGIVALASAIYINYLTYHVSESIDAMTNTEEEDLYSGVYGSNNPWPE